MQWTSVIAIYVLFWVISAFIMLPFGIRTHEELGEAKIPGQADSAPANFRPGRIVLRATLLSGLLTGMYLLNYQAGWITAEDLNFWGPSA